MSEASAATVPSLAVVVGAPPFGIALPNDRPVLVVEADQRRAYQLGLELAGLPHRVVVCTEVLAAEDGTNVDWHHFNDARLDGPADQAAWQLRYPNLQLLSKEQRCGRLLQDLVKAWSDELAPKQQLPIDLVVRQGDPMSALIGLGSWMQSVRSVRLEMPIPIMAWQKDLDHWLIQEGFRKTEDADNIWQRDPVSTLQLSIKRKDQKIAELEKQLLEITSQRDEQQARATHLERRMEAVSDDLEEIVALMDEGSDAIPPEYSDRPQEYLYSDSKMPDSK